MYQQCCGATSWCCSGFSFSSTVLRIRTFLVGSRGLGPDPGLNKWPNINLFGVCKSHKHFRNRCYFTFWFKNICTFWRIFPSKQFPEETWPKIYLGQDPDSVKNLLDPQYCSPTKYQQCCRDTSLCCSGYSSSPGTCWYCTVGSKPKCLIRTKVNIQKA
jgi:hypothetical protein